MAALVNNSFKASSVVSAATLEDDTAWAVGGSNRILYVLACCASAAPAAPTDVKWGGAAGEALTQIGTTGEAAYANFTRPGGNSAHFCLTSLTVTPQ